MMSRVKALIESVANRYDEDKFWRRYMVCQNSECCGLKRFYYVYYLRRVMSKHCCDLMVSFGSRENSCAFFASPPYCPHGLNGIVVSNQAKIGSNVTILQQVTIGIKDFSTKGAPIVGNNVTIGAGAKLIGPIKVGNNVTIGANAVVTKDIPDGATVVGNPGRVIRIGNRKV